MRTAVILTLAVFVAGAGAEARGQQVSVAQAPTTSLQLLEGDRAHVIGIHVTVDGLPFGEYWNKTFDAIFAFADSDSDGNLNAEEIRLVPSARAVRLSLGSGFTPPVASIKSISEIVSNDSQTCSREQLRNYYRGNRAGQVQMGYAKLPQTVAITKALIRALDEDGNGRLSQAELLKAEAVLKRLDSNDDELIGVGELVPNGTYPGSWAANALPKSAGVDLSPSSDRSLQLKQLPPRGDAASGQVETEQQREPAAPTTVWRIQISDQVQDQPLKVATSTRCESWSIPGPLNGLHDQLREDLASPEATSSSDASNNRSPAGRSPRAWLTALVDRDRNEKASPQEVDQWLALQRQLIHGQLLIGVYSGGGLFELLDTNHDAALSIRELRTAWQVLESASCTFEGHMQISQMGNVVLFVVSQGYPHSLARVSTSDVEWFRQMDRNSDGDVSRREFTGSPDAFGRLDKDRDGLISSQEAAP